VSQNKEFINTSFTLRFIDHITHKQQLKADDGLVKLLNDGFQAFYKELLIKVIETSRNNS
jgi:hypothetical protein